MRENEVWVPKCHPGVVLFPTALVYGQVELGEGSSVWYQAIVRGDAGPVCLGACCNVQDQALLHATRRQPLVCGDHVTLGHRALLHGCTVASGAMVGMGAIVLDGARVGEASLVAAGSLVPPGFQVPDGVLVMGNPCRIVRALETNEIQDQLRRAREYRELAVGHCRQAGSLPGVPATWLKPLEGFLGF